MTKQAIEEKMCTWCKVTKPIAEFCARGRKRAGYTSHCKPCRNAKIQDHYRRNRERILADYRSRTPEEREKARDYSLRGRYGITLADYEKMNTECDGRCTICGMKERAKRGRLLVDHDHATGKVRGLLCAACNLTLGGAADNPNVLFSAIMYLVRRGDKKLPTALTDVGSRN